MENEEKLMTGEESLKVISAMINKTRTDLSQSIFHFLFWGWLLFACSLSEFILWKLTDWTNVWFVWLFVIPGALVSFIYGFVKGRRSQVYSYATSIYVWTWVAFFFAAIVFFIVNADNYGSIAKFMLLIVAIPTMISGVIIKFRPLIWGAASLWILAFVAHFGGETVSGLAMPVAMITGFLVPGYLLKRKGSHDTVQGA